VGWIQTLNTYRNYERKRLKKGEVMAKQLKPLRLPKRKVVTIQDILVSGDIEKLVSDLNKQKASFERVLLIAMTPDGQVGYRSANVNAIQAVYLLENAKAQILDQDIWGCEEETDGH
jgi:hypothetical protein